ncbi:hypothetical protein Poli38472_000187 [Pythium oligandrum]|uniref:RNA-binding protein n=1 Tax=Pythium oligandrum TaxID=41045 RepID=A0A8K1CBM7_PYTOL|nr:hypothetical protein Poli38472_000187 [Pythium oligandrum]|eukprot:TMW60145.1 hypothetical protein Poli38472_000187 [Pythium oligandrum]
MGRDATRWRERSPMRGDTHHHHHQSRQYEHPQRRPSPHDERGFEQGRGRRSRSRSRSPPRRQQRDDRHRDDYTRNNDVREQGGYTRKPLQFPPSSTLILRGLTPNVTEGMIYHELASFRPVSVRVMINKVTNEHRGFGFADFDSVESATHVIDSFASNPLIIDNQPVMIGFSENNRPKPYAHQGRPHSESGEYGGNGRGPRLDWICDQCHSTNFARRAECFKCHAPKSPFAMEVPAQQQQQHAHHGHFDEPRSRFAPPHGSFNSYGREQDAAEDEVPSNVLAIRMIPLEVDEGELQVVFGQFEGVQDIRLIRDRATNQSRGFAFVEFSSVESATQALEARPPLSIRDALVRVSYARDSHHPRPPPSAFQPGVGNGAVPLNPIAAAALEQAQWALANGYGAMQSQNQNEEEPQNAEIGLDDINALLLSAAAAARPQVEEPKKPWPLPFETGGGMYLYVSEFGLYYDTDSMFYYDPQSKLYYNQFSGVYYRCPDGSRGGDATFEVFNPPPPVDNAQFSPQQSTPSAQQTSAKPVKAMAISLSIKDKKKPISFALKAPISLSSNTASAFHTVEPEAVPSNGSAAAKAAPIGTGPTAALKKKSAMDIAKWSQRQKEAKEDSVLATGSTVTPIFSSVPAPSPVTEAATVVDVPVQAPICLLCRRKFGSLELLRKHETLSKLHAENLAKAKQDKEITAAQHRERDEGLEERQTKKARQSEPPAAPAPEAATPAALESGIGAKMLKMMGWKKGEGLGKHGTGITAPVAAVGNAGSDTTGLGAKILPTVDLSEAVTQKERMQKMVRARYDAAENK